MPKGMTAGNYGGASNSKGLNRGGGGRSNGAMPSGSGGSGSGRGRKNGTMPSSTGDAPGGGFKGPKATTNQSFRPQKGGKAR